MRLRLAPEDDLLHPVEEASNFNESRYYNFFDPASRLGGWVRMGNRPNEGYAEVTTCLYLPSGSVAFMYGRPEISGHEAHEAGGMRFDVVEPFTEHHVRYDGKVVVLDEPRQMEDPRAAFRANPWEDCQLDLVVRSIAPAWGGEPEPAEGEVVEELDPETSFARGHTEQHIASTGTVAVGERSFDLDAALGLCDHSWGPRFWQSLWWYRWLTVNLGPDLGLAASVIGSQDGGRRIGGFLYDRRDDGSGQEGRGGGDRGWVPITDVRLSSDYDADWYHRAVHAAIDTPDRTYILDGEVWSNIPLRNRRAGQTTRITEGMTTWRCEGLEGSGLAEYLDQVVDGRPVGTTVGI